MKNFKLILNLMLIATSFMFFQCTSDYTAIPGIDGDDGIDGVDGVDGIDGLDTTAAACIECHSNATRDPIHESYAISLHGIESLHTDRGTGDVIVMSQYGNRSGCVQCHTSDGFIDAASGFTLAGGAGYPSDLAYPNSQTISCNTCHDSHRSFNFDEDGNDYALRVIDPVTLVDGLTEIDMDLSNACVACHQPRGVPPSADGDGNFTITSSRFGPHHGPQSVVLEGIYGGLIDGGSEDIPGARSARHRTDSSCIECHMGPPTVDGEDGAHTWNPTENACISCHTNGSPPAVTGYATDFQSLHDLLVNKNYISESGSVLGANGSSASSSNPLVVPIKEAQAIWNYKLLEEDQSNGVHNPDFAKALLKNSIEALE